MDKIRVLIVGCGNMGTSHARSHHTLYGFEIVGLVSRKPVSREKTLNELGGYAKHLAFTKPQFEKVKPDAVSINTYPDTHAEYIRTGTLNANAHVFVEKPLALTV